MVHSMASNLLIAYRTLILCSLGFFTGMWGAENQVSPEEKVTQRFKWELKAKLKIDQDLMKEEGL